MITNQPLVLDNGSGMIKAGFAGDEYPRACFPSYVGRPKHLRMMAGAVEGDSFIGKSAADLRGLLKLSYPMQHGIVTHWDDMEKIWQHIYTSELKTLSEEHPVLLTEAPLNPKNHRDKLAQIFFETFNAPALFLSIQAVLALYASGRTTGMVLDVGDGVSHSVPVFEGFAIPTAIQRADIAGRDVTAHLQLLLRKAGYHFYTSAEFEVVRCIKEKSCYLSLNPIREEKEYMSVKTEDYVLPDGTIIKLGQERYRSTEILFHPDIIGQEFPGLHDIVVNSIAKADMDLRRPLYSNIVLSGGTTMTGGFGDRLLEELKKSTVKDVKVKIYAPPERKYSTWIGGSILAALSTFKKMWVTAEEYQEDPDIIHKRFMN